jgi:hypothetical protein
MPVKGKERVKVRVRVGASAAMAAEDYFLLGF